MCRCAAAKSRMLIPAISIRPRRVTINNRVFLAFRKLHCDPPQISYGFRRIVSLSFRDILSVLGRSRFHSFHCPTTDLLPRINPVGFLTLPGHSGRASLRGISAPVVHISFCVRAVIATAFCQDANITTAITCVLSLGKNLTYHAARFLVCTRDKYYTAIQQINVSINRQYGIHPTAKDRGLSACYDRNHHLAQPSPRVVNLDKGERNPLWNRSRGSEELKCSQRSNHCLAQLAYTHVVFVRY